ncbi:MAG TPA: histidine kinase [Gaiellaceae bacterium]|jgi:PAS domain S-box-containing protein|nr:histidine kinase [Gaiellaceae bacterium]
MPALLVLVAAGATGGAAYVIAVSRIAPSPVAQSLLAALVCLTFVGTGVAALRLRPYAGFGLLLTAVGLASLISVLHEANTAAPYTVALLASNVVFAVLVTALLAYPGGRLGPNDRRMLVVAYLDVIVLQALAVMFDPLTRYHSAHPRNLALVDSRPSLATGLYELEAAVAAALSILVAVMLTRRLRAATPATRRQHLPVVAGGSAALLLFSLGLALAPLSSRVGFLGFGLALVAALALPVCFSVTLVQGRLSRAAVGELLLELRDPAQPPDLEEALRRALGDPTLRLGRLAPGGGYVDGSGTPLGEWGELQVATLILHQQEPIGMLVHDRSLRLRPELLDAVSAAAGFALANERALRRVETVEARNRALLGAIPDLMLRIDSAGTYLDVRDNESSGLPLRADELVGRNIRDVAPPDVADALLACAQSARESGRMHAVEYELELDGAVHYCESRMVPSRGGEVVIIMRDFTEKREADARLGRLAEEQAALRRVATLVASDAPPEDVFQLVTEEVCRLLGIREAVLERFDDAETGTVVGRFGRHMIGGFDIGSTLPIEEGLTAWTVLQTGAPAHIDSFQGFEGELAARVQTLGYRAAVGVPIVLAGSIWGTLVAALREGELLPSETERRMQAFAELVGLALASAHARQEVAASRLRIIEASDTERRRLERNLHDGAQQRLVGLSIGLQRARAKLHASPGEVEKLLELFSDELREAMIELRELAQGLHPAVLTERGLGPALEVLAARAPLTVELEIDLPVRLPEPVETAAYYAVSESLTNVAKHAGACSASVRVACCDDHLAVEIADDGGGGANLDGGSGLRGLQDRIETLDGELSVESSPDSGTVVRAVLPVRRTSLATIRLGARGQAAVSEIG